MKNKTSGRLRGTRKVRIGNAAVHREAHAVRAVEEDAAHRGAAGKPDRARENEARRAREHEAADRHRRAALDGPGKVVAPKE